MLNALKRLLISSCATDNEQRESMKEIDSRLGEENKSLSRLQHMDSIIWKKINL